MAAIGQWTRLVVCTINLLALGACGGQPTAYRVESRDASPIQDAQVQEITDAHEVVGFVKRKGQELALGNDAYRFRGVTFSSNYYGVKGSSITNPNMNRDHAAEDYARVADLGMNAVQLILSYRAFEDDSQPFTYLDAGWAWLDENVQQAKLNGLRVIFDMLMVPGGDWHTVPPNDLSFWTTAEDRQRFIALWQAIATRYADEPAVLAYSLLNEPVTVDSDGSSWWSLANDTIAAIRNADSNHLVIVNPIAGVKGNYGFSTTVDEYRLVADPNVVYDIHFYEPPEFVFQGASFMASAPAVGAVYPDLTHPTVNGNLDYVEGDTNNPTLPAGNSDWQDLVGTKYPIASSEAVVSYPAVTCYNMTATSTAYFDDFEVDEFDATGQSLGKVIQGGSGDNWTAYSVGANNDCAGGCRVVAGLGHASASALAVSGDYSTALLSTWSYLFAVTSGHSYQISGWAKGSNLDASARCEFTLGFYKPTAGSTVTVRNRSLLNDRLAKRRTFGEANGVPMAVTEFGLTRSCFEDDLGGMSWLADMVSVLDAFQENYVYFTYHNDSMGIYGDEAQFPNPNTQITAITDFFRSNLSGGDAN